MCSRPDVTRARIAYSDKADEEQMVVGCNRKFLLNICQSSAEFHKKVAKKKFKVAYIVQAAALFAYHALH